MLEVTRRDPRSAPSFPSRQQSSIAWLCHRLVNQSLPDGHMACFLSFAGTNNAAMNKLSLFIYFSECILGMDSWKWDCCVKGQILTELLLDMAPFPSLGSPQKQ